MARVLIGNLWNIEKLKQYFAPSGFGLGAEAGEWVSSPDNITKNGFYRSVAPGVAPGMGWYVCIGYSDEYKTVLGFKEDAGGIAFLRTMKAGVWGEWEYANPPLTPGVEYRTTERWNGKPVYIKAVELGHLPDTANAMGTSWVDGSFYGSGVKSVIACGGCLYKGDEWAGALPYVSAGIRVDVVAGSTTVGVIASDGSFSDRTATVWVKYTKE